MKKSAKKQQSHVPTIQRTITSKKRNINNLWKGSRWFIRQCLRSFYYFLRPERRKCLFRVLHLCRSI